jgi:predicted transposase YdaD
VDFAFEKSLGTEIVARLGDEEFIEAAGVLEMIAKTPNERNAYDARLKFRRDETARLLQAQLDGKLEGRLEGRLEGEQIGKIRVLQELLGISKMPDVDLDKMDLTALEALAADLQSQLPVRG